jgi:hypothetical protein
MGPYLLKSISPTYIIISNLPLKENQPAAPGPKGPGERIISEAEGNESPETIFFDQPPGMGYYRGHGTILFKRVGDEGRTKESRAAEWRGRLKKYIEGRGDKR